MASLSCIFCYAQIVSDNDQEEVEVKYESHLMGRHNMADLGERKLAITRTLIRQINNNDEVKYWEVNHTKKLSEKIEKALKINSSDNQQFTFENEDFDDDDEEIFQEKVVSNPDATVVQRDLVNVDDKDDHAVKVCSMKMTKMKKNMIRKMADADISVPWYEWGHHVCVECGNAVFLGSMERHLSLHRMSLSEYKKEHKIPESDLSIPSYECQVCGVAVSHTNRKIMTHLQLHSIDMGSYYFQYVQGEGAKIKPESVEKHLEDVMDDVVENITNKSSGNRLIISRNLFQKRKSKSPKESLPSSSSCIEVKHPTSVPKSSSQTPKNKRSRLSTEPGGELPWYESSWHKCLECGKVTTMGSFFISHVKKEHKMAKKEYLEKYPEDKVGDVPYWKCGICNKGISWGVRSIASHLSKAHSLVKEEYASIYIDNNQNDEDMLKEDTGDVNVNEIENADTTTRAARGTKR